MKTIQVSQMTKETCLALHVLESLLNRKIPVIQVYSVEFDDDIAPIVTELLGKSAGSTIQNDVASIVKPSDAGSEIEQKKTTTCQHCGEPFSARRIDQVYCSKPECQKTKRDRYAKKLPAVEIPVPEVAPSAGPLGQ
jgi:hypothetical protein